MATVVRVANEPLRVASELLLIVAALGGAWVALTTTRARRAIAVVMAVAAVVAWIVSVINGEGYRVLSVAVRIVLLILAVALGKYAVGTTVGALKRIETEGTPVPAATRGVLFMNLKSGGGKAERFHLMDECARRGIRPVVLEPGQDLINPRIPRREQSRHRYDDCGVSGAARRAAPSPLRRRWSRHHVTVVCRTDIG